MSVKVYPEPLGSIFLTGPDGHVYELPEEAASRYRVTPERVRELGHLPITPYCQLIPAADQDEVSGRHFVIGADGLYHPHREVLYGAAPDRRGRYYVGYHLHPNGTEVADFVVDPTSSPIV